MRWREQNFFDCGRQHVAVTLAQINLMTRQRILIAATAHEKHRLRAGMIFFERALREARVITAPFIELQRGVVARVAEQNRL